MYYWDAVDYLPDRCGPTQAMNNSIPPDMPARPLVSVLIAVHNGEPYLAESLESVLRQTFRDWELIVVNDGSTDATGAILDSFADRDRRVRIVCQRNRGQTPALNMGLHAASGAYVARLDADDLMRPERLERQVRYLAAHPDVVLLGSAAELVDSRGQRLHADGAYAVPVEDGALRRVLIRWNPFYHPSVMFRREAALRVGGYDERYSAAQDYALWIGLSQTGKVANLGEVLLQLRIHDSRMTRRSRRRQMWETIQIQLRAIDRGIYPKWNAVFIDRHLAYFVLPDRMRYWLRALKTRMAGRSLPAP